MRSLMMATLYILSLTACKQRADEEARLISPLNAPHSESLDGHAFGFNGASSEASPRARALQASELRSVISSLGALSPGPRLSFPCTDLKLKTPATDTLRVSNQFDLTKCLRDYLADDAKDIISALLRYYGEFFCDGESLQRYQGSNFFDITPASCLTAGRAYWRQRVEWQLFIKDGAAEPTQLTITQLTSAKTAPGYCAAQRSGDSWLYEPCNFEVRTQTNKPDLSDRYSVLLGGTCEKRETTAAGSPLFYHTGRCLFKVNGWDINLNFTGGNSPPRWTAQNREKLLQADEALTNTRDLRSFLRPVAQLVR